LVETSQKIPSRDEASLRPTPIVDVVGAASRVFDERSGKRRRIALDPAPGTRTYTCAQKVLDSADAVIDVPPSMVSNQLQSNRLEQNSAPQFTNSG